MESGRRAPVPLTEDLQTRIFVCFLFVILFLLCFCETDELGINAPTMHAVTLLLVLALGVGCENLEGPTGKETSTCAPCIPLSLYFFLARALWSGVPGVLLSSWQNPGGLHWHAFCHLFGLLVYSHQLKLCATWQERL